MKHIISNGYNSRFSYFADETAFGIHALLKHDAGPALVVATDEVVGVEHGHPVHGEPVDDPDRGVVVGGQDDELSELLVDVVVVERPLLRRVQLVRRRTPVYGGVVKLARGQIHPRRPHALVGAHDGLQFRLGCKLQ